MEEGETKKQKEQVDKNLLHLEMGNTGIDNMYKSLVFLFEIGCQLI
jgi:hypothetical protein